MGDLAGVDDVPEKTRRGIAMEGDIVVLCELRSCVNMIQSLSDLVSPV
jgi:hypothetical protein